jgi:23S rRNA (guanosine2251-2'-O)-methyltransferase
MAKSPVDRSKPGPASRKKSHLKSAKSNVKVIWSIHPVLEVLKTSPGIVKEIIVDKRSGIKVEKIIKLAEYNNVIVRYDKTVFQKGGLVGEERHQGVVANIVFPYVAFSEMLAKLRKSDDIPFILALDSIQDPQNLGAIIRSAVAAGCKYLILPKDRAAQIIGTVAKTSAGAVFHINVCRVTNLVSTIDALREAGIWVFGATVGEPQTIYQADFSVPVCLVIGNEEKGIRPLVKKHCDVLVTIPMSSELNSLNASVAAGVILFEIARQRAI